MSHIPVDSGLAVRRLQQELRSVPDDPTQNRPKADPQQQTAAWLQAFDKTARLIAGTIIDTCALAGAYKVAFEKGCAPCVCTVAPLLSHSAFGARDIRTLQPGTMVLVAKHDQLEFGLILATIPHPGLNTSKNTLEDMLVQAGRARVDEGHKQPLRMADNGGIPALSAGRPFDSLTHGEWGAITETGLRIWLDSFMAEFGAGEGCGVTAFYHDALLRIAAYNLQFWTAGYEREALNDQDEYIDTEGWTPYPWEQLGLFTRGDPRREITAEEWQLSKPWYSHWEPKYDDQQPWHRTRTFHGYLGQGQKVLQQAAPQSPPEVNRYYARNTFIGLHNDWTGLDGTRIITSAKQLLFVKYPATVAPQRLAKPEQAAPLGDDETNYKHASQQGSGQSHKITSRPSAAADQAFLQQAAGVLDLHTYINNYATVHPFVWHAKDWFVPDEASLAYLDGGVTIKPINFGELQGKTYLAPPEPVLWNVDHRYEQQCYYQNASYIIQLDDGGVAIGDGFGSELRMTGGHVFLTAPGGVWLKSGANVHLWAGRDVITKARNSVDISATRKSVRIKADQDLQMVAGNSGTGAVLIESRSEGTTYDYAGGGEKVQANGIQFKARSSEVVTWAENIYLRTGGGNVKEGEIFLDAAKGREKVTIRANQLYEYLVGGAFQLFGTDGKIKYVNEFLPTSTVLAGALNINGAMILDGNLMMRGWLFVAQGHIATEYAPSFAGYVATLSNEALQSVRSACIGVQTAVSETLPKWAKKLYQQYLMANWYDENQAGHDTTIRQAEFTFRTTEEYKAQDFVLYEDRWQQLSRLNTTDTGTGYWVEEPVDGETGAQKPFPGKDRFDNVYCTQDLTLLDAATGKVKPRGEAPDHVSDLYTAPAYGTPSKTSLDEYMVIG